MHLPIFEKPHMSFMTVLISLHSDPLNSNLRLRAQDWIFCIYLPCIEQETSDCQYPVRTCWYIKANVNYFGYVHFFLNTSQISDRPITESYQIMWTYHNKKLFILSLWVFFFICILCIIKCTTHRLLWISVSIIKPLFMVWDYGESMRRSKILCLERHTRN